MHYYRSIRPRSYARFFQNGGAPLCGDAPASASHLRYSQLSDKQTGHASDVLPGILAAILQEVPPARRSSVIRRASSLASSMGSTAIPLSVAVPRGLNPQAAQDLWNGMAALLLASAQGSPSDTVATVLSRAASLASGQPFSGDPAADTSDPVVAQVCSAIASSSPSKDIADIQSSAKEIADWYDCWRHEGYLGGSILDGIKGIAQEVAGVFSTKKDLQGDYTRAKYRYERDQTETRKEALTKAAAALVGYLKTQKPDDALLQDPELVGWAEQFSGPESDIADAVEDAQKRSDSQEIEHSDDEGSGAPHLSPDSLPGGDSRPSPSPAQSILHTETAGEAADILAMLLKQQSQAAAVTARQASTSSIDAYRYAAALFWLRTPDDVITTVFSAYPPSQVSMQALSQWVEQLIPLLSRQSSSLMHSVARALQASSALVNSDVLAAPVQPTIESSSTHPSAPEVAATSTSVESPKEESVYDRVSGVPTSPDANSTPIP